MKKGNWVPMDKGLVKTMSSINRPFSVVEAMFSYSVDQDCCKEGTLRGYAKLWGWSVGKVKRFVECLRNTSETVVERKGNGSGTVVRFVDGSLKRLAERKGNGSGTVAERKRVTTINPNPNPNPTTKKKRPVFNVPEWVDKELWADFLKMRIKIKKPITSQRAVTGLTNKLKSLIDQGYSQDQVVGEALEKCWQTFYEPKDQIKEPEDDYVWGQGVKDDGKISTDGPGSAAAGRINKPRFAS